MSKCSGGWIKLVEATVYGTKPQMAAPVARDGFNRIAADAVGIVGVVAVADKAFGCRVKLVNPAKIGGNPQIALIIFHEIQNKVGAYAPGIPGVVLVHDEGVAVVAIESVPGGKP